MNAPSPHEERKFRLALTEREAADALHIGLSTFLELVAEGKMPKPIYVRPRLPRYDIEAVKTAWKALKEAQSQVEDINEWD